MDGQWEFYWGQLLGPDDFAGASLPTPSGFFHIPGFWNGRVVDGQKLPGHGFATFRLKVKTGGDRPEALALRIEDQFTAYRLFVDGRPAISNGRVGKSREETQPQFRTEIYAFHPKGERISLILQVANFHITRGGPYHRVYLGSEAEVRRHQTLLWALDMVVFGILTVIGFYYLVINFLRRKDNTPLLFGLFCLLWSVRIPCLGIGGKFITVLFPDFPFWLCYKIDLTTWFLTVPSLATLFILMWPDDLPRRVVYFLWSLTLIFLGVVFFTPVWIASYTVLPYEIICVVCCFYFFYILFRALIRRRKDVFIMLIGFTFFILAVFNDVLYDNQVIYSYYLIPSGVVLMVLTQAFLISRRSADAYRAVETLSEELKEKNLLLSRMDKLKDEFLANTSHELRTPLHGIIGMAESLQEAAFAEKNETTAASLSMIIKSAGRLSVLIDDILDFSKLRAEDVHLDRKTLDLRSITDVVLTLSRRLVKGKNLDLVNSIPESVPNVLADEDRLQQILFNLIGNAVKFTDQGEIRVTAAGKDAFLEVAVSDTGMGIHPDSLDHIFEPFKQADDLDTKRHGGTGLGLSITKHLVELHGGAIWLESELNQGTTVWFTLPVSLEEAISERGPSEAITIPTRTALDKWEEEKIVPEAIEHRPEEQAPLILVVDDDPFNLQVVTGHLASSIYRVKCFISGYDALKFIRKSEKADLVLLDIMMPGINGYQVCRKIRNDYSSSELPVIMLTAKNRTTDLVQGFESGANDYLTKPFTKSELLARIEIHIKVGAAYVSLRQNMSLRKELEQRKETEQHLRMTQRRLSEMLNRVDAAILAVNESNEICFCNRMCEQVIGWESDSLLGQPVDLILGPDGPELRRKMKENLLSDDRHSPGFSSFAVRLQGPKGKSIATDVDLTLLDFDEERLHLLVIRKKRVFPLKEARKQTGIPIPVVVEVMHQNRQRLNSLESALDQALPKTMLQELQVSDQLQVVDMALESLSRSLAAVEPPDDRRQLIVELLNLSLDYWSESTGTAKADLASKSGIWRVYTNKDGWDRTQTLDRYLDLATLPKMPRWKKVSDTASFVLTYCQKETPLRRRLEALLAQYRNLDWK